MKNRSSVRSAQAFAPAALVCIIFLLVSGSAALSQPFPSFMLDSSPGRNPGFDDVSGTCVAFGPDVGLVVWSTDAHVRGVRLDRNGVLLDSVPIEIDGCDVSSSSIAGPGVAWSGQNFLVAWSGYGCARCAIVEPDGLVSARAMLQDSSPVGCRDVAVAFDGSNFLASWIANPDTLGLTAFFSRVSQQGVVLDRPPRMVAPLQAGRQYGIALCFHQDRYLAVWNDFDTIGVSGNFVFPDGSIADSAGFHIRRGVITDRPTVTHNRNNFVVAWNEEPMVKLGRVTDGGQVLDSAGVMIDSFSVREPGLLSNGDTTLVFFLLDSVWHDDSLTLVGVRVDSALNRLDAVPVKLSVAGYDGWGDDALGYAAALCGGDYFITWRQPLAMYPEYEDNAQALCRRMSRNGELLDSTPQVLSYGAAVQDYPDVASDGQNFLAVWADTRRDSVVPAYSIRAARFSPDGTLLDPHPIWIDSTKYEESPAVAFGGGCYLVTWFNNDTIWAKRISPAGVVLDSLPLHMPEPNLMQNATDVAFGDSSFLVVWTTAYYQETALRRLAPLPGIHGCRVTPAGVILDAAPRRLEVNPTSQSRFPRVAFDGVNFLVARYDSDGVNRCARVGTDGALLDTTDITVGAANGEPEVAYGNGVYLVSANRTPRCWRVSPDGYLLDSVPHGYSDRSQVVFDGTDFMLLCQSQDNPGQLANHLGAIRITPSGRVLDSTPFTLVTSNGGASAWFAAMSANAASRVGVVFTDYEPTPYLASRICAAAFPAVVGIHSQRDAASPVAFRVTPNPASRLVSLSFNLAQAGPVYVTAFDVTGRRCASLFSGGMKAGRQTLSLDTRRLANGVYFLRLEAGATTHSTRLVVAR